MKAVLVIDMQEDFLYPDNRPHGDLEKQIAAVDAVLRSLSCYRLFIEYRGFGPTVKPLREAFTLPSFIRDEDDSAFEGVGLAIHRHRKEWRPLDSLLRSKGIDGLVLAGVNAESCVFSTAKDAESYGYSVYTTADLVGSNANVPLPKPHQWYRDNTHFFEDHKRLLKRLTA